MVRNVTLKEHMFFWRANYTEVLVGVFCNFAEYVSALLNRIMNEMQAIMSN